MIRMNHLYKTYLKTWPALKDVSVIIHDGEFVFLTGPSGAGKTTFLKLIYGEELPTRGELFVQGRRIKRFSHRKRALLRQRVGVIFQDFKLIQRKSTYDNLALAANVVGFSPREARSRINEVLSDLRISAKSHVPIYQRGAAAGGHSPGPCHRSRDHTGR